MGVVTADFADSYEFTRRVEDPYGRSTDTVVGTYRAVVSVRSASPSQGDSNPGFGQQFTVFIESGADVEPGDIFTYQGRILRTVGYERGDSIHPMTGADLGWFSMSAQRVGTDG